MFGSSIVDELGRSPAPMPGPKPAGHAFASAHCTLRPRSRKRADRPLARTAGRSTLEGSDHTGQHARGVDHGNPQRQHPDIATSSTRRPSGTSRCHSSAPRRSRRKRSRAPRRVTRALRSTHRRATRSLNLRAARARRATFFQPDAGCTLVDLGLPPPPRDLDAVDERPA